MLGIRESAARLIQLLTKMETRPKSRGR